MVFRSGMSKASAGINTSECVCACVCVLVPPLPLHDLNFTALGLHPSASNKKTETTILASLPSLAPVILHPSLQSHSSPRFSSSCCVCLAALPGRPQIRAPCFLRARISPVQCPISENETRESGCRNAPFLPRQPINYRDGKL